MRRASCWCTSPTPSGGYRALPALRLPAHETAFAMTVHKAQGSEFDEVLVLLPAQRSRVLTRELLYTALTRARQRVTLAAAAPLLAAAVATRTERQSGLRARLRDAADAWRRRLRGGAGHLPRPPQRCRGKVTRRGGHVLAGSSARCSRPIRAQGRWRFPGRHPSRPAGRRRGATATMTEAVSLNHPAAPRAQAERPSLGVLSLPRPVGPRRAAVPRHRLSCQGHDHRA